MQKTGLSHSGVEPGSFPGRAQILVYFPKAQIILKYSKVKKIPPIWTNLNIFMTNWPLSLPVSNCKQTEVTDVTFFLLFLLTYNCMKM